jgi:casein kinase II subunit beta
MVEVDPDYIKDPLNLKNLQAQLPNMTKERFRICLRMILAPSAPNDEDLADEAFLELNQESSDLYGLIHARYVLTPRGLAKVY